MSGVGFQRDWSELGGSARPGQATRDCSALLWERKESEDAKGKACQAVPNRDRASSPIRQGPCWR